jgi:hypothetical protein
VAAFVSQAQSAPIIIKHQAYGITRKKDAV